MNSKFMLYILILLLILSSCITDTKANLTINEKITKIVEKSFKEYDISGLSISITNSEKVIYENAFGLANENTEFTIETLSSLKSVSKPFTCLAIMKLVNNGLIDLDASVITYLPEFKPKTFDPDRIRLFLRRVA